MPIKKGYGYYGKGYPYIGKYGKNFTEVLTLLKRLLRKAKEDKDKKEIQDIISLLTKNGEGYYGTKKVAEANTEDALKLINKLLNKLEGEDKNTLQKIKDLLSENTYPYLKKESNMKKTDWIFENVASIDFIEEDDKQPFRFSGIALKGDSESKNGRYYPKEIVEKAVKEAKDNLGELRLMVGHPKDINETSPEKIVGKFLSIDYDENGNVPFEAEIVNTNLGKDTQEALRTGLWTDLSIRANGSMTKESVNGRKRDRVTNLSLKGLDFVSEGGVPEAKINKILSESSNGGDKMTKQELLQTKEVQEIIEETKDAISQETENMKTDYEKGKTDLEAKLKESETKRAEAEEKKDIAEAKLAEIEIAKLKESKISELKVSDKVKELLRKRVTGKDEKEIAEGIEKEIEYIKEISPIFKEGPNVHGIPPKDSEKPKGKTDEEILREGHPENWDIVKEAEKIAVED